MLTKPYKRVTFIQKGGYKVVGLKFTGEHYWGLVSYMYKYRLTAGIPNTINYDVYGKGAAVKAAGTAQGPPLVLRLNNDTP